jgi:hypothetical protein
LLQAIGKTKDPGKLAALTAGLVGVVPHLEPRDAAEVAGLLVPGKSIPDSQLPALAEVLSSLAARMERRAAAAKCAEAVDPLLRALRKPMIVPGQPVRDSTRLTETFLKLLSHLEPGEAAAKRAEAVTLLHQALDKSTSPWEWGMLAERLAVVARQDPDASAAKCAQAAHGLLQKQKGGLPTVCRREPMSVPARQAGAAVGTASPFVAVACAATPAPPPLPAQALVDLLKQPLCQGAARGVILAELSRHYGRAFADPWDFVRFAEEQKLALDLTSPSRLAP